MKPCVNVRARALPLWCCLGGLVLCGLAALALGLGPGASTALAAEGEAAPAGGMTMWDTVKASGPIGAMIVLLSVVATAMTISFFVHFRRDEFVPPDLYEHLNELFEGESYDEALEVCENNPSWLSLVLAAGLRKIDGGYEEIVKAMRDAGDLEFTKLNQRIGYLNLIAQIAPMLGLLGTVQGMIVSFNVIASKNTSPKPSELATGVSMALVTTLEGLLVAIPFLAVYVYFKNQIERTDTEVWGICEEFMDRFKQK